MISWPSRPKARATRALVVIAANAIRAMSSDLACAATTAGKWGAIVADARWDTADASGRTVVRIAPTPGVGGALQERGNPRCSEALADPDSRGGRKMQDTLLRVLKIFAGVAIPLASLATGLRAAREDHLWLVKRPSLLLRSLLTILVIVPVGAVLFLEAVRAPMLVEVGITIAIIAIGLGPPAALKQAKTHQESIAFELGLKVALLLVAIVYIPLFVAIHRAIFHHAVTLGV